jgi:hypothetical protein
MAGDIVGHKPDVNLFSFAEYLAACCEDEGAEKGFGEFRKNTSELCSEELHWKRAGKRVSVATKIHCVAV